jgi:multicomponent Na+:H+ antiporter subunit G
VILVDALSWLLLLAGSFFVLVGGIGVLRMPDVFTRLHPAGLTDTLGATLILAGLMIQGGWTLITIKLILIFVFLLFTSPTASHALAKAALSDGIKPLVFPPASQSSEQKPPEPPSSKS